MVSAAETLRREKIYEKKTKKFRRPEEFLSLLIF